MELRWLRHAESIAAFARKNTTFYYYVAIITVDVVVIEALDSSETDVSVLCS